MKDEIEFFVGSGNVFADMGLPDAEELQLKSSLAIEIRLAVAAEHLTRPQAASKLGISREHLAVLLDGPPFEYSVGQLIGYLNCLDRDVTLSASVRERVPGTAARNQKAEPEVALA